MLPISRLESAEHRTSWLELFYDLVFVAAVSQLGNGLARNLNWHGSWIFIAMFVPVWWCWSGSTNFASRYQLPEVTNRLLTDIELMAVAVMASSIGEVFIGAYRPFVIGYALVRVILIAKYLLVVKQHVSIRAGTLHLCIGFALGVCCWLSSLWLPQYKEWLWLLAVGIDLATVMSSSPHLKSILPNASHLPERFGLFTLIVLGESVVAVVTTLQPLHVGVGGATRGLISLLIAFAIWWLYFDGLNDTVIRVAQIYKRINALNGWICSHLILHIGLCVISVGVRLLIPHPTPGNACIFLIGSTMTLIAISVVHLLSLCAACNLPKALYWQHSLGPLTLVGFTLWHCFISPIPAIWTLLTVFFVVTLEIVAEVKENKNISTLEETLTVTPLAPV